MANAREIQTRIKSIQDTMKITNAMYMISSAKVKKARNNLEHTKPYFTTLQGTIARIVRHLPEMEHRYFADNNGVSNFVSTNEANASARAAKPAPSTKDGCPNPGKRRGYIVISADKGLAGAYNHNIIRLTEECLKQGQDNLLFVVGEMGRNYFIQHNIPIAMEFHYTVQDPNLTRARDIADYVLSLYDAGTLEELYIIYTPEANPLHMENKNSSQASSKEVSGEMQSDAKVRRLLPLEKEALTVNLPYDVYMEDIRMIPSPEGILEHAVPDYITGFIYGALVEAFCSEQNARMTAMETATDNAKKILKELQITYNRVRQGAITQEITEVIAGARAQKKRRRKT